MLETGRAVVLPRVPSDGAGVSLGGRSRPDISQVSAPVLLDGATIGACGLDYLFSPDRDLDRALACASLLASLLTDRRSRRRGFPAEVQAEIERLARYRVTIA